MILSKTGAMTASEATQYLTSTLNGYKLSVEDASRVVDVFSKLDMSAATSSKELAIAFSRTANSASDMGVSFEELAGWITTVSETTRRSASTVGESFKTVFARMANIKLGVAVDPESGEAINDVEKALSTLDIHLRKSPTEWRSAQDVLTEIGNNWDTYNDKQKNTIVTAIAGVRQAEVLRAAFNNFDKVLGYTADAYDSAGSSAEKYGTYLDSIEAKQNKLTTALTDIAYQPQWEELYKIILDVATVFTTFVGKTVTSVPALASFLTVLIGMVSPSITKGINNVVGGLNDMADQVKQFGGEKGDTLGGAKRTVSVNRLANSIENVVNASDSYSDVQKKVLVANKRTIASEFLNIDAQNLDKLTTEKLKAEKLRKIIATDAEARTTTKAEMATLKSASAQTVANASTNLLTISIGRLATAAKLMAVSLLTNPLTWVFAAASVVIFLKQKYDDWNVTIEEQKEIVDNLAGSVEGLRSEYEQLSSKAWRTAEEERQLKLLERELQAEERLYAIEQKRLAQKIINEWTDDGVPEGYDSFGVNPSPSADVGKTKVQQQTKELNDYKKLKEDIIDLENKKIKGTISDAELATLESLQKQAEDSETALLELYQSLVPLIDTGEVMPEALSKFINDLEISLGLTGDYSAKIEDLKNQNKFLAEVTDKVTKSQSLSKDEVEKLKQLYPELEDDIKETANGWTIEKKALDEVSGAVSALESAYTTANNMMTEVLQSGTAIRLGILASELEGIKSVYDAINFTEEKTGAYEKDLELYTDKNSEEYKLYEKIKNLGKAQAEIKRLEEEAKRRADGDGFTPTDKDKDKKDKEVDVLKAYKARKKILESEIELSKAKQREYKKDSAEYVAEQKYQHDKYIELRELAHQEAERLRKLDSKLYDDESSQIATLKDDWARATDSMATYKQYMFDLVQSFKENYGKSLLDNVQNKIDAIENKRLNDSNIEYLKDQIEKEKEKLKLIEKQTDEESKKTEEIRKQKQLIKSLQGQRDIRVYRAEKGWTWEQDREKIIEEQEKLTEMETELQKAQIQAVIDSLEEKLADAEKAYDDQIAQLQKELKNAQYLLGLKEDEGDQLVLMLKQMNAFGDANKEAVNSVLDFADALSKSMGFGGIDKRQMLIDAGYTTAQIDKLLGPETSSQPTYTKTNKGTYISSSSSGAYDSSGNYTVGTSGNAPSDTKVGTIVNTAGGAVKVVEKGTPGANYNPASGLYSVRVNDDGGLNYGKGMMLKNVVEPERVLSPEQTKSFEKLVNYLPIMKPVIETYSFGGKPQGTSVTSTDNSITIQNLNIQAPNGATLQSLLLEAKNIAKINKR